MWRGLRRACERSERNKASRVEVTNRAAFAGKPAEGRQAAMRQASLTAGQTKGASRLRRQGSPGQASRCAASGSNGKPEMKDSAAIRCPPCALTHPFWLAVRLACRATALPALGFPCRCNRLAPSVLACRQARLPRGLLALGLPADEVGSLRLRRLAPLTPQPLRDRLPLFPVGAGEIFGELEDAHAALEGA